MFSMISFVGSFISHACSCFRQHAGILHRLSAFLPSLASANFVCSAFACTPTAVQLQSSSDACANANPEQAKRFSTWRRRWARLFYRLEILSFNLYANFIDLHWGFSFLPILFCDKNCTIVREIEELSRSNTLAPVSILTLCLNRSATW